MKEIGTNAKRIGKLSKSLHELTQRAERGEKVEWWSKHIVIIDRKSYEELLKRSQ